MRTALLSSLLLVVLLACQEGPAEPTSQPQPSPSTDLMCCTAACGPILEASIYPAIEDAVLQQSTLTVCRNTECFTAKLEVDLTATAPGSGKSVRFVDPQEREKTQAPLIDATVWGRAEPTEPRRLNVTYRPWQSSDFKDGDRYELTLKDAQGAVLIERQTTVTYARENVCCSTCGRASLDGGSCADAR